MMILVIRKLAHNPVSTVRGVAVDEIRKLRISSRWQIREVWKIVEWRNGCVYKTRSLGHILCPSNYELPSNYMITSVSTKISRRLG